MVGFLGNNCTRSKHLLELLLQLSSRRTQKHFLPLCPHCQCWMVAPPSPLISENLEGICLIPGAGPGLVQTLWHKNLVLKWWCQKFTPLIHSIEIKHKKNNKREPFCFFWWLNSRLNCYWSAAATTTKTTIKSECHWHRSDHKKGLLAQIEDCKSNLPRRREEAIRRESIETTTSSSGSSRK